MLPKAWIKHGEIFSDEEWRTVFVCTACEGGDIKAPVEQAFRAYDAAAFWAHVQKLHLTADEDGSNASRTTTARNCERENKSLSPKSKAPDIICIDLDDEDTDELAADRDATKDQCNRNCNTNTAFWEHVQKLHMTADDDGSNASRTAISKTIGTKCARSCERGNKSLSPKSIVPDIICIDLDDEDTDELAGDRDATKDQSNTNCNNTGRGTNVITKSSFRPDSIQNEKTTVGNSITKPTQEHEENEEHGKNTLIENDFPNANNVDCMVESESLFGQQRTGSTQPETCQNAFMIEDSGGNMDKNNADARFGYPEPGLEAAARLHGEYNVAMENMSCSNGNIGKQTVCLEQSCWNSPNDFNFDLDSHAAQKLAKISEDKNATINANQCAAPPIQMAVDKNDNGDTEFFSCLNSPPLSEANGIAHRSSYSCTCQKCGKKLKSDEYFEHIKTHEQYQTPLGNLEAQTSSLLSPAVSVSTETSSRPTVITPVEHPFRCYGCSQSFCELWQLQRHERIHVSKLTVAQQKQGRYKTWRYKCDICGRRTKSKKSMTKHRLLHSGRLSAETAKCDICGKLVLKKRFQRHQSGHIKETHTCPLCPRTYSQKQTLSQHIAKMHPNDSGHNSNHIPSKPPNWAPQLTEEEQLKMMAIFISVQRQMQQRDEANTQQHQSNPWNAMQPPFPQPYPFAETSYYPQSMPSNSYDQMLPQDPSPHSNGYHY